LHREGSIAAAASGSSGEHRRSRRTRSRSAARRAPTATRVFVIAGVRLQRDALAEHLAREPGIDVVGGAPTVPAGVDEVRTLRPDVVLVDLATVERPLAIRLILDGTSDVKVVALGVADAYGEVVALVEAGVSGYVGSEEPFEELVSAIESAAHGTSYCSPRLAVMLLERLAALTAERRSTPPIPRLTARELEIVELIGEGLTNKQIARRLFIEVATVKNHVHHILEKLGVHHRKDAVVRLRAAGLFAHGSGHAAAGAEDLVVEELVPAVSPRV
jgi:two-component system nitrate/nitrite response regulator NarL